MFDNYGQGLLTEERARNIQMARSDGRIKEERLEDVWPKNEDWHGIRIAYDVSNISICSCAPQYTNKYIFLFNVVVQRERERVRCAPL